MNFTTATPRDEKDVAEQGTPARCTPTPTIAEAKLPKDDSGRDTPNGAKVLIVDWEGPGDLENPKNWSFGRKWAATLIVSMFTFISPVSSSMVAPATDTIADQFGLTNKVVIAMITSIFVLAYAIGPLILGLLSEIFGRSKVLQGANLFYLIWNLVCGFAQNEHNSIAEKTTWRWVFWSTTILDAAIQVAGVFFLQETFAPALLERKASDLRKKLDTDPEKGSRVKVIRTVYSEQEGRTWKAIISKALTRPFVIFWREPIASMGFSTVSCVLLPLLEPVLMTFSHEVFLTTIPTIFDRVYHQKTGIAGLNYIGLGVGLTLSSQINARYMDKLYVYFKNKNNGVGEPEFRMPSMILGSLTLPIGLLLSGWAAQEHVHWIVTDIGMAFVGMGVISTAQLMQTYVVDCFTLHAASALASIACLRSLAGFGFPLFAPAMYDALGFGKGDTILAAVSIAIGWPAPLVFWKYGKAIRSKSKYARK